MLTEPIYFKDRSGKKLKGERLILPGFELLDLIYIQDGFMGRVYELSTGSELINSQGFTKEEAIRDCIGAFIKKNLTDVKILEKFYGNDHAHGRAELSIINHSPSYIAFKEKRNQEKLDLPFYYSPEDRAIIQELIDIMVIEKLPNVAIMRDHMNKRIDKYLGKPPVIEVVQEMFNAQRNSYYAMQVRAMGIVMPESLRPFQNWQPREVTWNEMLLSFNAGRKKDITVHIPVDILNEFALLWDLYMTKNNFYGYSRFYPDLLMGDLIRLAIDLKKGRDETETMKSIRADIKKYYDLIEREVLPYKKQPDEIYI